MEYRFLGGSGLQVPVLTFGTATFGGSNEFFKAWGNLSILETAPGSTAKSKRGAGSTRLPRSSDRWVSSWLFLDRLVSTRACLRFTNRTPLWRRTYKMNTNLQLTANCQNKNCLTPGVHLSTCQPHTPASTRNSLSIWHLSRPNICR